MRPPAKRHSGELLRKLSAALSQYTFFYGLQYTNAIFAITFTNMAPVLTFLIAVLLRTVGCLVKQKEI